MSLGLAVFLLALVVLVAIAAASFFRHTVAALFVLLALPLGLLLQAAIGIGYSVFAIALLATVGAVIHTIADTLRLCRAAQRPRRTSTPELARERAARSRSDRPRIAA